MLPYMNVGTLSRTELQLLNQLHCRRKRRHRTIFTDEQLEALENLFQETKYPDVGTREQLARKVHLREEKVEVGKSPSGGGLGWGRLAVLPCTRLLPGPPLGCGHSKSIPEAVAWRLPEGTLGPRRKRGSVEGASPFVGLEHSDCLRISPCQAKVPRSGCPLATRGHPVPWCRWAAAFRSPLFGCATGLV
jgi:hypothetical protein